MGKHTDAIARRRAVAAGRYLAGSWPALLVLVACGKPIDGAKVPTAELQASIHLGADASSRATDLSVRFTYEEKGGSRAVLLRDADTVRATVRYETVDGPVEDVVDVARAYEGSVGYEAELDVPSGAQVEVSLDRSRSSRDLDVGVSAPSSTVTMPETFEVIVPEAWYVGDSIELQWSAATDGGDMEIDVDGDCLRNPLIGGGPFPLETEDDGSYFFEVDRLPWDDEATEGCEVEVSFRRVRSGTLDPAYGGGGIYVARSAVLAAQYTAAVGDTGG
ncbi:MAG: hypothetical protein EP330_00155 [Deltaproteobacteria bacterium]|nr:MAG: hypothetical protein EP330_00155 [Deltaproteobacteria bacterium]